MKPPIVCLCGSTRFKDTWIAYTQRLEMAGIVVLGVSHYTQAEGKELSDEDKTNLDELHMRKIDVSDFVLVLNVNGYIGWSTGNEIDHAMCLGKPVFYISPLSPILLSSKE